MKEIEYDGFITREEDLMKSEPLKVNVFYDDRMATPMTECDYPKCEECRKYMDGYCTVPMVINKQNYIEIAERIVSLENTITELQKVVYDEILGEEDDDWVLTEGEYNELSPLQKYWYDKRIEDAVKTLKFAEMWNDMPKDDGSTVKIRAYAKIPDERYRPLNDEEDETPPNDTAEQFENITWDEVEQ